MTDEMIFLTNTLDIGNLNDEKYIWPFYLTLIDSKYESLSDRVDNAKHQ